MGEGPTAKRRIGHTNDMEENIEEFWGDQLENREGCIRIAYNNCDGLQIKDYLRTMAAQRREIKKEKMLTCATEVTKVGRCIGMMREWNANIVCLAETQTAWEVPSVSRAVMKEIRRQDQYGGFVGSSSAVATASVVKPGGSAIFFDGDWGCRIIEKGEDPHKLGRWSYIKIKGRNNCKLSIFSVYRCCKHNNIKLVGLTSSYSQQVTLLKKRGIKKTPQEAILQDLKDEIIEHQNDGSEIMICIDANEQWEDKGSKIEDFSLSLGLEDIARFRHQGNYPPTYTRKNTERRIDFMLCSEEVLNNVTAYGMAPISTGRSLGDHRAQYVDINIKQLLNINSQDCSTPSCRRLKSPDPKCVRKYIKKLRENFEYHKIHERLRTLVQSLQGKMEISTNQKHEYERLDEDIFRLCKSAEKEIKLFKQQKYAWSPDLDIAYKVSQYWKLREENLGNLSKTLKLIKMSKVLGFGDTIKKNKSDIEKLKKEAFQILKKIRKKSKEKRIEFLHGLAEKYASENNMSKQKAILALLEHEEIREMYRYIRINLQGPRQPQLAEVWTKSELGEKIILSESADVEKHLLQRNSKHLRQAADTPFAEGPLGAMISWDGSGELADRLINGDPLPDLCHLNTTIKAYLEGMAAKNNNILDSINVDLSIKQYRKFWKDKKENTATSPFGLHIGHFKSVLSEENEDILDIHRYMLTLPFKYGFVPNRWSQTVQIMLEKDKGSPWTHRLRIIELFDSQLNAGMQIFFGKRMVYKALEMGMLHDSAYGSVPQRTAQDAVVEKIISLDLMRILKISGALFDCDAKSCYDRIIPALQSIFSRRLGIPSRTANFFAKLWYGCKHYVRTKFGVSEDFFVGTFAAVLYGIGQGNGAGPAFWLSHLVVMFCVLDTLSHGIQFRSPSGKTTHKSPGMGFVDDVTLGCTHSNPNKSNDMVELKKDVGTEVLRQITNSAQHWETMLYTDGGRLELSKCYWIYVSWKWINGIAVLKAIQDSDLIMNLWQSEIKQSVVITRKTVSDAPRVLGCHVAVDGKWKKEVGRWKLEALRFANKVKNAGFNRTCGAKIYPTIWLPKLRYISPAVCFTKNESKEIDKPVVRHCLSSAGYSQRFPRRVVFGPASKGGLEWESCYSLQVYEKIKFFISHFRRQTKLGNLLKILVQSIQVSSGIQDKILETQVKWIHWVEPTWVHFLQQALWDIEGEIKTEIKWYNPPRENDRFIMDIFYARGYSTNALKAINRCRIHLRVITISDICTYDGQTICHEIWNMIPPRESSWEWSLQIMPAKKDRNIWFNAIRSLVNVDGKLSEPLGKWTEKTHQRWKYMVTKDRSYMLRYENNEQKNGMFDRQQIHKKRFGTEQRKNRHTYPLYPNSSWIQGIK